VITQALQGCAGGCKCCVFRGVSFPCRALCCTALRSRWCQSGVRSPWMLQRWSLCTRCEGRDKDRLPATGQIHPRLLPSSALHWKRSSSLAWSRGDSKYGPPPCRARALLSLAFALVQNLLRNRVFASGSICVYSPLLYGFICTPSVSEPQRTPRLSPFYLFSSRFRATTQDSHSRPED
jgi:hypothetical protein